MLASTSDVLRLSLHVIAATIWVGGQIVLAALVPVLRKVGDGMPRVAARAYSRAAWPAFVVLIATGVWNIDADSGSWHGTRRTVLVVKLVLVLVSGASALWHSHAKGRLGLALGGATTALSALAVVVLGVALAG